MGEARKEALRVDFDSQIKLEFNGAAVTSDAGLIAYRELDEAPVLTTGVRCWSRYLLVTATWTSRTVFVV